MKRLVFAFVVLTLAVIFSDAPSEVYAATADSSYSVAVLDFSAKDRKNPELGKEVALLLTAFLSETGELVMVEREQLEKVISEQALGISGTIKADTAATIGQLTGAKVLISGSVMSLGKESTLIAKIIGTETGRVFAIAEKVGPADSMTDGCMSLAMKINEKISSEGAALVAAPESASDFVAEKKKELEGKSLPSVSVVIPEMHVGQIVIDPAVQTEMALMMQQIGFTVIDPSASNEKPVIEITGEAFSESGIRRGDLVSCKARAEIKIIELATGKVLAVDRQTEVAVDTSEQIAGKTALQKCGMRLLKRNLEKMIL